MTLQEAPQPITTLQDVLFLIHAYVGGLSSISVPHGLPELLGTTTFYGVEAWGGGGSGVFQITVQSNTNISHHTGNREKKPDLNFSASRGNSIYGNSNTVTPLSLKSMYMIRY